MYSKLKRNENIFIIVVSASLLLIVFLIAFFSFQTSKKAPELTYPTPIQQAEASVTPLPSTTPNKVRFDQATEKRLLEKLKNRQPLTTEDAAAKARILAQLPQGETSGIIYQSNNIIIDYVEPVDEFQGEITTTNIATAKSEAVLWFRAQGMSQKGVCDLPLNFYPSYEIVHYLNQQNTVFYSLPEGC